MKLYLTRQRNGDYMLTAFKPLVLRVKGNDYDDAYMRPGDPIGVRHLCADGVKSAGIELLELESVRVDVTLKVITCVE